MKTTYVRDNSGNYGVSETPNIIYGIGVREKNQSNDEIIFLLWKTQSRPCAMEIIKDIQEGRRFSEGFKEIILVKTSIELVDISKLEEFK